MIEIYLVARLSNDAALAALVGTRIFPVVVRQETNFPCLVYRRVAGSNGYELRGPDHLRTVAVEVKCWSTSYEEARRLAEAVRLVMDGYRDISEAGPFRMCQVTDGEDDFEEIVGVFAATVVVSMRYDARAATPN